MMVRKHRIVLFLLMVVVYCVNRQFEHIPVNNGWGWDGKHYARLTIHFEEMARNGEIDSYQYQRIFTPALIYYGCKWTGITLNEESVLSIYGIYNLLLLCLGMLLFFGWSSKQQLSKPVETIGFAALFLNYAILKNTPYYPILTDTTVFVAGILLMYWVTTQNKIGQWILALISPFVFPLFNWMILPLVIFPNGNKMVSRLQTIRFFAITKWIVLLLMGVAMVMVIAFPDTVLPVQYQMHFSMGLIPISAVCIGLYVWMIFQTSQSNSIQPQPTKWFPWLGLGIILLIWFISRYVVLQHSVPEEGFTPLVFGLNVVQQTLYFPLAWIWAHIIYLGPAVVVLILWGRTLIHHLFKQNDGIILFAFVSLLLMTGSETRQFMYCWPVWVWLLLPVCSSLSIKMPQAIAFVVLCLIQSKCWLPINTPESFMDYDYTTFPNQRYFMNHGPFMSLTSNLINLFAALVTTALTWFIFCFEPKRKNISSV